jgi:hypothetical protein
MKIGIALGDHMLIIFLILLLLLLIQKCLIYIFPEI